MVIFHSYVSLPEGQRVSISDYLYIIILDLLIRGSPPQQKSSLTRFQSHGGFSIGQSCDPPRSNRSSHWRFCKGEYMALSSAASKPFLGSSWLACSARISSGGWALALWKMMDWKSVGMIVPFPTFYGKKTCSKPPDKPYPVALMIQVWGSMRLHLMHGPPCDQNIRCVRLSYLGGSINRATPKSSIFTLDFSL